VRKKLILKADPIVEVFCKNHKLALKIAHVLAIPEKKFRVL
jgi:hypothetical protein